ncbi:hypothetical protein Amsp01_041320 [Amycolatopsis sp. NBRC 101858]|nr:hypothetical protein Amsp01_041320 [Amycolatopsis sp. NBRC 101858]
MADVRARPAALPVRGLVAAGVAALAVFIALLISAAANSGWAATFDQDLHTWLLAPRTATLTLLARTATVTATPAVATVLVLAIAAGIGTGTVSARLRRASLVGAIMAPALLARYGLSQLVARQRPPREDWAWHASGQSFPSGHTTAAALAAGRVGWLAIHRVTSGTSRIDVTLAAGSSANSPPTTSSTTV